MNRIEYDAYYRQGLVNGLVSRGVGVKEAEAFVANVQNAAIGALSPDAYVEGFKEALSKKAASQLAIIDGDNAEDEPQESFLDKLKRYLTYGGMAAGGFALGNYWPEIRTTVGDAVSGLGDSLRGDKARDAANTAPDDPK